MPSSSPLAVSYRISLDDYHQMTQYLCARQQASQGAFRWAWFILVAGGAFAATRYGPVGFAFVAGMVTACVVVFAYVRVVRRRSEAAYAPREGGYLLCRYQLSLSDAGISIRTPYWSGDTYWSGVVAVDEGTAHVFFRLDTMSAYAVPNAAFRDERHKKDFIAFARACQEAAAQSDG